MAHSGLLYSQNRCKSSRSRCARTLLKVVLQDLLEPDLLMLREVLRPFEQAPTVLREDRLVAVPLQHGFPYLTAVMDLDSRNVLSWRLLNTLAADFCVEALDMSLSQSRPEIHSTDHGAQFPSVAFTSR